MTAFVTRMPAGFPGQVSRDPINTVIEMTLFDSTNLPAGFGLPVKTVSGKMQGIQSGDTAALVTGFCVRPYPFQSTGNAYGNVAPVANGGCNRLREGYFMGVCQYGTPAEDGTVYVRVDTGGHGGTVGGLEATSDTTHNSAITGARWTGNADASNNAEVAYNV